MINAYIVVRKQKNVDNKYIVCLNKEDALKIALEISNYWIEFYRDLEKDDIDYNCYGRSIYNCYTAELFSVDVMPQEIKESGEK